MTIVEHKNHAIKFNETTELWHCHELGFSHASLKSLKAQIDRHSAEMRRANVSALFLDSSWGSQYEIKLVTVGTLAESSYRGEGEAWITQGQYKDRSKVSLDMLYPLNARSALEAWVEEKKAIAKAQKAAEAQLKAIKHHTKESLLAEQKKPTLDSTEGKTK